MKYAKKCIHFRQHYNIDCNTIYKLDCGHCTKTPNPKRFSYYSGKQPCPYFEQNRGQRTRVKMRTIADTLTQLNLNIEYMKIFLNRNAKSQPVSNILFEHINNKK